MSWRGLLTATAVALLAACSGSTHNAAPSTSSSPSAASAATTSVSSTTTTLDEKEAVKSAYLAYWSMVDRLVQAPDPNDPELSQRIVEPALSDVVQEIRTRLASGERTQIPSSDLNRHDIRTVGVDRDAATVRDCFVDGRVVIGVNGDVVDGAVVTKTLDAKFVATAGEWKLRSIETVARQDGSARCAE